MQICKFLANYSCIFRYIYNFITIIFQSNIIFIIIFIDCY